MTESSLIIRANELLRIGQEVETRRLDYVEILCLVDVTAPRSLVLPVRDAFDPRLPNGRVRVCAVGKQGDVLAMPPDLCVCIQGAQTADVALAVCELAIAHVPVALVVESALDVPRLPLREDERKWVTILSSTSSDVLLDRMAEWIIAVTDKDVACAANFPFCRKAKARQVIADFAWQSASEVAQLSSRSEMPSMTDRQIRLALALAAINGEPLAMSRIPEMITAAAAGFGSRAIANNGLGRLPFFGRFFKMGFGYIGTGATGMTLQRHHEHNEERASAGKPRMTLLESAAHHVGALASSWMGMLAGATGGQRLLTAGDEAPSEARSLEVEAEVYEV